MNKTSKLLVKFHPKYIAWVSFSESGRFMGTLPVSKNHIQNLTSLRELLTSHKVQEVYFENPHVVLDGERLPVIRNIQSIQRLVGIFIALSWEILKIAPQSLVQEKTKPSKEEMILEAKNAVQAKLRPFLTDLELLCISDCLLLYKNLTVLHPILAQIQNSPVGDIPDAN